MTVRLSIISFAGTARTLVAVGRSNYIDIFWISAGGAPRSTWTSSPSPGVGPAGLAGVAVALTAPLPAGAAGGADGADGRVGTASGGGGVGAAGCPSPGVSPVASGL